jgi:hypothetical protein
MLHVRLQTGDGLYLPLAEISGLRSMEQRQAKADGTLEAETRLPISTHPEEMNARVAITLAGGRSLIATARATPVGLIAVGVLVSAILLSTTVLVRAAKQQA